MSSLFLTVANRGKLTHPNQVSQWKKQALEILQTGFEDKRKSDRVDRDQQELIEHLYQRIGQLQVELDWLKKKSEQL